MKILYLIHQFYPEWYTGTERIFLNLATMIQKCGHKVKVMTYSYYKDSFYDQSKGNIVFKEFIYKGIPVLALRHKNSRIPEDLHHGLENKEMSHVAGDFISKENPDLVHIAHPKCIGELIRALNSVKIPYILTLTDFFLICPKFTLITSQNTLCSGPEAGRACQNHCPEFPKDLISRRLETARDFLLNAKMVTSLSEVSAEIIKKEFPGLEIKVINPGLRYSTLKSNNKIYKKGDKLVLCYAGSLNPHKGVHILIKAFKKVSSDNISLKIYGTGTDKSYSKQLLAMAKGDRRIEFCDVYSQEQVGEVLQRVDVVVVPSLWYETYCLILHEALSCNLPVIASDVGVMAGRVKDGVDGFLFRMGDSHHLREVLQRLLDNPAIMNEFKRNISSMVIPRVEQEAYAYERAYAQIVASR